MSSDRNESEIECLKSEMRWAQQATENELRNRAEELRRVQGNRLFDDERMIHRLDQLFLMYDDDEYLWSTFLGNLGIKQALVVQEISSKVKTSQVSRLHVVLEKLNTVTWNHIILALLDSDLWGIIDELLTDWIIEKSAHKQPVEEDVAEGEIHLSVDSAIGRSNSFSSSISTESKKELQMNLSSKAIELKHLLKDTEHQQFNIEHHSNIISQAEIARAMDVPQFQHSSPLFNSLNPCSRNQPSCANFFNDCREIRKLEPFNQCVNTNLEYSTSDHTGSHVPFMYCSSVGRRQFNERFTIRDQIPSQRFSKRNNHFENKNSYQDAFDSCSWQSPTGNTCNGFESSNIQNLFEERDNFIHMEAPNLSPIVTQHEDTCLVLLTYAERNTEVAEKVKLYLERKHFNKARKKPIIIVVTMVELEDEFYHIDRSCRVLKAFHEVDYIVPILSREYDQIIRGSQCDDNDVKAIFTHYANEYHRNGCSNYRVIPLQLPDFDDRMINKLDVCLQQPFKLFEGYKKFENLLLLKFDRKCEKRKG